MATESAQIGDGPRVIFDVGAAQAGRQAGLSLIAGRLVYIDLVKLGCR